MSVLADRYRLLAKVGEGGMGVVWHAHDTKLGRDVAVKLLRPFVAADPEQKRRFDREARTLAALANDHIVRVFDYVDAGDRSFLVMEFVHGCNLADATVGRLPLAWNEVAAYAQPVCEALAYAHAKGVIHRDLTPANILIEREGGRVLTTDYGLARIARSPSAVTSAGVLLGTPEYWSPEQALGRDSDGAADMYALGCILYLLLSGHLPFEGDDRLQVGLRRAHEDAPPLREQAPHTLAAAAALVDALLSRNPARRPDARTLGAAIAATLTEPAARLPQSVAAPQSSAGVVTGLLSTNRPTERLAQAAATLRTAVKLPVRRRSRRRTLVAALCVAAVAGGAGLFAAERLQGHAAHAPDVVALRAGPARAKILETLPSATVSVVHRYSTRIGAGRVIGQRPPAKAALAHGEQVTLIVSKGSPFAAVPAVAAGTPAQPAKTSLERHGFRGQLRYTPSWTVRKGTVITLEPSAGTRLRRPAAVRIVVASGYPREVVPPVENIDLGLARTQLEAKHLRYQIVYRLSHNMPRNQVLRQLPRAGATVYRGSRIRLTVARTLRWVKLLADSGSGPYESAPFIVPDRWRIRYRLAAGDTFTPTLAQFAWSRDGELFGDGGSFFANGTGAHSYGVSDGSGTYRLAVSPYAGTSWYVEVDALE